MAKKLETKAEIDMSDLISISEAARLRNVSHAAIQDLIKRGRLSPVEIGGRRFVLRREVMSFAAEKGGRGRKAKTE